MNHQLLKINRLLFEAALTGDNQAIIALLKQGADINSKHDHQATALLAATSYNHTTTVKLLIDQGANVDISTDTGMTALYKSARECYTDITRILLEAHANIESDTKGYTPLYAAASSGCVKDVQLLLDAGAKINSDNVDTLITLVKYTQNDSINHQIIHNLIMYHYWKKLDQTLPRFTNSLKAINNDKTFEVVIVRYDEDLSWIAKEFKNETITIYNKGADDLGALPSTYKVIKIPNVGWFGGTILLHLAEQYNNLADRTLFLQGEPYAQHLFLPLIRYKANPTSLCQNIIAKCVITTLLKQSNELKAITEEMWNQSKYGGHFVLNNTTMVEFAHKFIDKDLIPEQPLAMVWGAQFAVDTKQVHLHKKEFYQKMLPLFNETYSMVDFSLEKLWDPMFHSKTLPAQNFTQLNNALFEAAWAGDKNTTLELLDQGADINSLYSELGATPLYGAAKNNQIEMVKLLINKGANLNTPIIDGATPLYTAAFNCYVEITKILIDAQANKNAMTSDGWTPLWGAIYSGCAQNVRSFLDADVEILWDHLRSPLYTAAKLKDEDAAHDEVYKMMMNHYWKIVESYPLNNSSTQLEVVVVRYSEDLSWIAKEFKTEKVIVYNKGEDDLDYLPSNCEIRKVPNVGWLGGTYLYHIVHYYDQLADKTLFLQGFPHDSEAFLPFTKYHGYLNSTCAHIIAKCEKSTLRHYTTLLAGAWTSDRHNCFSDPQHSKPLDYNLTEFVHNYIDPHYNPEEVLYVDLGAQFMVNASQIHIHPKALYQKMLNLFDTRCSREDFYLEKVWDIMFKPKNITELNKQLFNAAWNGDIKTVIDLLESGAEINSLHDLNATPIYAAARNNQTEMVKLLTSKGANLEISINNGATPLYTSIVNCYNDITKLLIDAGANLEVRVEGYTPVFVAIYFECTGSLQHLLKAGAKIYSDILTRDEIRTPLSLNSFRYNGEEKTEKTEEIYPIVLNHYWNITAPMIQKIDHRTKESSKSFEIVVVRYKEELDWVTKEFPHDKVTIYNKGPDDIGTLPSNCEVIKIPNVGYLGGTYLKHIVNRYDSLADRTLFMQGHPYDVNIYFPLIRHKEKLQTHCRNIISKCVNSTLAYEWDFLEHLKWDYMPRYKDFVPRDANMIDYTHKYIGDIPLNETIYVTYGAIFAVDKEKIQACDLEYYKAILPEFNYVKPMVDHYQERLWDPMFEYCREV